MEDSAFLDKGIRREEGKGCSDETKREKWDGKREFLFTCIGNAIGLGNVWRFPYLCYKNGGGVFLIPYTIFVIFGGIPLLFMETAIGQFMSVSALKAWRICPLFQGLPIAMSAVAFFSNCYYIVVLAWASHYLFASFTTNLPWITCGNWWNTKYCSVDALLNNATENMDGNESFHARTDPATEYWENRVLGISTGIDDVGTVKWDLALCLLFAWVLVYLCICKGIKTSGKAVYVTATLPYVFMVILLINGAMLPGARAGVEYYLTPDISRLRDPQVWVDAGAQVFFSYAAASGVWTTLGSFNSFNFNSYRDCFIVAGINSGTSLLAGFIIFPVLGNMALLQNKNISDVAESGPGLAFIAYPKAVSLLPVSPLWSAMFFAMLVTVGIDSQLVYVEHLITNIVDQWPHILRVRRRREVFVAFVCATFFFLGLPMVTNGGVYVFQIFHYYASSHVIFFMGSLECIALAWCYGVRRFYDNIEMMLGYRISRYMMVCWTAITPALCMMLFVMSSITYADLTYSRSFGTYIYPSWALALGWLMAMVSGAAIPAVMLYMIVNYCRRPSDFRVLLKPRGLKEHQLRPIDIDENVRCDARGRAYEHESIPIGSYSTNDKAFV